jgi:hypothetical protein
MEMAGNCRPGSDHFFYKIYYNKNIKTKRQKTVKKRFVKDKEVTHAKRFAEENSN